MGDAAKLSRLFYFHCCSADDERDWPPCEVRVVFSGWQPILNVRSKITTVDPMSLPLGNPIIFHGEFLPYTAYVMFSPKRFDKFSPCLVGWMLSTEGLDVFKIFCKPSRRIGNDTQHE